jgi:hypothetical protein
MTLLPSLQIKKRALQDSTANLKKLQEGKYKLQCKLAKNLVLQHSCSWQILTMLRAYSPQAIFKTHLKLLSSFKRNLRIRLLQMFKMYLL